MNAHSKAYVSFDHNGKTYKYYFTGVTSIEHSLTVNLEKDSSQGSDIVNGARNKPNQITLSVIETDTEHTSGWAADMLEAMDAVKRGRYLCKVVTSMGTYKNMLLTGITATQDEENQCGWSGTLVFIECLSPDKKKKKKKKKKNNSSSKKNTGSTGSRKVTGSAFQQLLQRAGINQ